MRGWLRRWRVYLIVLPVVLLFGIGTDIARAVESWNGIQPLEVAQGKVGKYDGFSFQVTDVTVQESIPGASLIGAAPSADAVPVVAKFRGRIDDPRKAGKVYCRSFVQNGDDLEWKAGMGSGFQAEDFLRSCDQAQSLKDAGKRPKPHEWYEVEQQYWVPRHLATDLQLVIRFQSQKLLFQSPRYLRFAR